MPGLTLTGFSSALAWIPAMEAIGPHMCPGCGERVSAFAAGCALCGAELDPRRASATPTLGERIEYRLAIVRLRRERKRRTRG